MQNKIENKFENIQKASEAENEGASTVTGSVNRCTRVATVRSLLVNGTTKVHFIKKMKKNDYIIFLRTMNEINKTFNNWPQMQYLHNIFKSV